MKITKKQVEDLERSYKREKAAWLDLRRDYAIQQCPLKIGQIVEVLGFSYTGKKMKINHIGPAKFSFQGDWRASGLVLNKDGREGKNTGEVTQKDWEQNK